MRLLCTLKKKEAAQKFAAFLVHQGIQNQLDISTNTDWGSPEYGDLRFRIWVYEEDQFNQAQEWLNQFENNPNDHLFAESVIHTPSVDPKPVDPKQQPPPQKPTIAPVGRVTLFFLITCIFLFIGSLYTSPSRDNGGEKYRSFSLLTSPVTRDLLYDYPQTYVYLDKLIQDYGIDGLQDPQELPEKGKLLYQKLEQTPYWQGFYRMVINKLRLPSADWTINDPMFEKIKEGEAWRLFTPALLHYDIFHLLFNMLWLIILGKQIEQRLGFFRYILFTLLIGIISNTAQYLMAGANFMGYSGILCGMFTFIWVRQRHAAWEGYQLLRSTIILISIFIGAMFALQVASFLTELYAGTAIAPAIANTAHLTGALCGWIFGRMKFFAWKRA